MRDARRSPDPLPPCTAVCAPHQGAGVASPLVPATTASQAENHHFKKTAVRDGSVTEEMYAMGMTQNATISPMARDGYFLRRPYVKTRRRKSQKVVVRQWIDLQIIVLSEIFQEIVCQWLNVVDAAVYEHSLVAL